MLVITNSRRSIPPSIIAYGGVSIPYHYYYYTTTRNQKQYWLYLLFPDIGSGITANLLANQSSRTGLICLFTTRRLFLSALSKLPTCPHPRHGKSLRSVCFAGSNPVICTAPQIAVVFPLLSVSIGSKHIILICFSKNLLAVGVAFGPDKVKILMYQLSIEPT